MTEREIAEKLHGVIPAIVVPLRDDGEIDTSLLARQAEYLCGGGIQGIFVCGTTGEGAYLSSREKIEVFRVVRQAAPPDVVLCAACIQPSTAQVIAEIRVFEKERPDFVVAVTPYYLAVDQAAILEHYRAIAAAAPAPLILYNIPQNTHNPMALDTILALAGLENVAGIKDSSGNFTAFSRGLLSPLPGPFAWIQGEDYLEAASYLLGAQGAVTGLGNVWIEPYVSMHRAAAQGDAAAVRDAQGRVNALYELLQVTDLKVLPAIKAACELLGRGSRRMRIPSMALRQEDVDKVKGVLERLELL
jgi:4-hydroxy-tetrahydrodipicolinate synthase